MPGVRKGGNLVPALALSLAAHLALAAVWSALPSVPPAGAKVAPLLLVRLHADGPAASPVSPTAPVRVVRRPHPRRAPSPPPEEAAPAEASSDQEPHARPDLSEGRAFASAGAAPGAGTTAPDFTAAIPIPADDDVPSSQPEAAGLPLPVPPAVPSPLSEDNPSLQATADPAAAALGEREIAALIRERLASSLGYPESARRRGIQGDLVLGLTLSPEGRIARVSLLSSSGNPYLDRAVLRALRDEGPYPYLPGLIRVPVSLRLTARS